MPKNIVQAIVSATQKTLEGWSGKIKETINAKEQEFLTYEEKKRQLLPLLKEACEKGVSVRELAKIMGINHTTIARWVRETKEKQIPPPPQNEALAYV